MGMGKKSAWASAQLQKGAACTCQESDSLNRTVPSAVHAVCRATCTWDHKKGCAFVCWIQCCQQFVHLSHIGEIEEGRWARQQLQPRALPSRERRKSVTVCNYSCSGRQQTARSQECASTAQLP